MKVILIVEALGLKNKFAFEEDLEKEGFVPIEHEEFAYSGDTTTSLFSTRAYILQVVEKALKKSDFSSCKIIFQVGENPLEAFVFDKQEDTFSELKL